MEGLGHTGRATGNPSTTKQLGKLEANTRNPGDSYSCRDDQQVLAVSVDKPRPDRNRDCECDEEKNAQGSGRTGPGRCFGLTQQSVALRWPKLAQARALVVPGHERGHELRYPWSFAPLLFSLSD